ncbi:MAG TPA: type II toxin-antitoxin system RelE/ParE family toxin [Vicinamibacterales bacterium]|nr:type II toxin-antitoxin system RelE/ParE family toxin [Vicinamibacterales bacterium]
MSRISLVGTASSGGCGGSTTRGSLHDAWPITGSNRAPEIRLKGKAGIARALYVTAKEQRLVILRAFIKKTEKTPTGEIGLALQRAKELKP